MSELPDIKKTYPALPSMLRKYDRFARKDCFRGSTREEFEEWRAGSRRMLRDLLGLDRMEECPVTAEDCGSKEFADGSRGDKVLIMTEPGVSMPVYILVPPGAGCMSRVVICPPGHDGAGKYSVAGCSGYNAVSEKIEYYNYDYGRQFMRLGYVTVCPDCRGFGERREDIKDALDPESALRGDCYRLAHMGEPLGIPVAGMFVWDLMRLVDYIRLRGEWDTENIACAGFSGGGMQTLFLAALDERVSPVVISGYMYGYRDALLEMNSNCACNYVPHLWEHFDMGDIACLIAPRPLIIQSCRNDRLNGRRGIINAVEQVDIIRKAYGLLGAESRLFHEICDGPHRWHGENIERELAAAAGQVPAEPVLSRT